MTPAPQRWTEVTRSQFPHEAEGLRIVHQLLPGVDPFRAWSNFEFRDGQGKWHEVDLLVVGRRRLHLVELKYYSGVLRGDDLTWRRDGHLAEDSPLKLARRKAQRLASKLHEELVRWAQERGTRIPDRNAIAPASPSAERPKRSAETPSEASPTELLAPASVHELPGASSGHPTLTATAARPPGEVEIDYVGSVANAAKVVALLHRGEKRLVFCDSRQLVEEIGAALRERGVTTFLSHASLSADGRHRAEQAFAEARDCVIVATSTLELGIDVGDLDRVIQVNCPPTIAAFLQRLGRTGRRPGTARNCLFLALDEGSLLWTAGLVLLWSRGFVEPVVAPPEPRHIVAQQLLALCLQEHRIGRAAWVGEWNGLAPFDASAAPILRYLLERGFIERDGELLFVGPSAEKAFGHRHFMGMTAVFTAPPQFVVLSGRDEIGRTDPMLLTQKVDGPRLLLLGGRSWQVNWVDWKRRRCFVEPAPGGGKARWLTPGVSAASFRLTRAVRSVLLGADPPVPLTERAQRVLAEIRDDKMASVHPGGTVIARSGDDVRWWTWAGYRANATRSHAVRPR